MSTAEIIFLGLGLFGVGFFVFVRLLDYFSMRHAHRKS